MISVSNPSHERTMFFSFIAFCYAVENHPPIAEELEDLLRLESLMPGVIYKIIVDDLKRTRNDKYVHYLSLRSSTETENRSNHVISSNYRGYQTSYEREIDHGLPQQKRKKVKNENESAIPSDLLKKDFFKSMKEYDHDEGLIDTRSVDITDLSKSAYDDMRHVSVKNEPIKRPINHKNLMHSQGLTILKKKKPRHLLEEIILTSYCNLILKKEDSFSYNLLKWMTKIIDYIAISGTQDSAKGYDCFQSLYGVYQSLLFVFTAYQNAFSKEYYENTMHQVHSKRLPTEIVPYMQKNMATKSGMDAFAKAIFIIGQIEKKNDQETYKPIVIPCFDDPYDKTEKIYYEMQNFIHMMESNMPVFTYVTGISSARFPIDDQMQLQQENNTTRKLLTDKESLDKIIYAVKKTIQEKKKAVLIIDTTIQLPGSNNVIDKEKDPAFYLLKNLQQDIASGQLIVFLTKSHQKYGVLGVQKMRSGNLTLICNNKWQQTLIPLLSPLDDVFDIWKDEMQWITYLYALNHGKFEQDFLRETSKNAKFLFEKFDLEKQKQNKLSGPMILLKNLRDPLATNLTFHGMQTFGFPFTNNAVYGGQYMNRLNIGLEPKKRLEEIFSSLGSTEEKKNFQDRKANMFYGRKDASYKRKTSLLNIQPEINQWTNSMNPKMYAKDSPISLAINCIKKMKYNINLFEEMQTKDPTLTEESFNELTSITLKNAGLYNLQSLPEHVKILEVDHMTEMQFTQIKQLKNLTELTIKTSNIKTIQSEHLPVSLEKLKLSLDSLESIRIDDLMRLTVLEINGGNIKTIQSDDLPVSLKKLILSLQDLESIKINELLNLTALDIMSRKMKEIRSEDLPNNLIILKLSLQDLESIKIKGLLNLTALEIVGGEIKAIQLDDLPSSLQKINFSYTPLETIYVNHLTKLQELGFALTNPQNIYGIENLNNLLNIALGSAKLWIPRAEKDRVVDLLCQKFKNNDKEKMKKRLKIIEDQENQENQENQ